MTPKEKAEELAGKYWDLNYSWDGVTKDQWSKEGAIIAVNEILQQILWDKGAVKYWNEVKKEIEAL